MNAVVDTNVVAYYLLGTEPFVEETRQFWRVVAQPQITLTSSAAHSAGATGWRFGPAFWLLMKVIAVFISRGVFAFGPSQPAHCGKRRLRERSLPTSLFTTRCLWNWHTASAFRLSRLMPRF